MPSACPGPCRRRRSTSAPCGSSTRSSWRQLAELDRRDGLGGAELTDAGLLARVHAGEDPPARAPRPDVPAGGAIADYSRNDLRRLVRWIESDGIERSAGQVVAEVAADLGFQRPGRRVLEALEAAVERERRHAARTR